jgi:hypothetical protein
VNVLSKFFYKYKKVLKVTRLDLMQKDRETELL